MSELTWIKHDDGPMPVPGDTLVATKFPDGDWLTTVEEPEMASELLWEDMGEGGIAKYAIVTPSPTQPMPDPTPTIDAHYTKYAIQPMEFSLANGLDPAQHTVIKYVVRYRDKHGVRDLRAAIRVLELMIEREENTNG